MTARSRAVGKAVKAKPQRKAPTKAIRARTAPKSRDQPRPRAARPTCPVCGSRDVDVAKPARKSKAASKLAAGVDLASTGIVMARDGGLTCNSCGYRQEATI